MRLHLGLARLPNSADSCAPSLTGPPHFAQVWHEPGALVGEPAFVPAPGAAAEDEGAVLSVLTQADGRAALLVLDGSSFDEVARAVLPYGLPNGFHGGFLPARPAQ